MSAKRQCAWMAGPAGPAVEVPAVRWWLVIARDVLANQCRRAAPQGAPARGCRRFPKSPRRVVVAKHTPAVTFADRSSRSERRAGRADA